MQLADRAARRRTKQFMCATSDSVYRAKEEPLVIQYLEVLAISKYGKTKMAAKRVPLNFADRMPIQIVRSATVYGYSPRMRLGVSISTLSLRALTLGNIAMFGASQKCPSTHIEDRLLEWP